VTVLGDLAQGTAVAATDSWASTLAHLGKPGARIVPLTTGYRVPAEIVALANRLLPRLATGVSPAVSIRRSAGSLAVRPATDLAVAAALAVREALAAEGSIAVIARDAAVPGLTAAMRAAGIAATALTDAGTDAGTDADRVTVVPASLAKGLEYDQVIVVEPADVVDAEPRGLHRLYVVLTRAVSRLVVLHARPLPAELA
jgi:DNA helicase IV